MKLGSGYVLLLLLFIVLGVYYPSLFIPFNSVDDMRMINALFNSDNLTISSAFTLGGSGYYYRPLLIASFIADKNLWGLNASFMHLENILLHAVNVLLLFYIAKNVAEKQRVPDPVPRSFAVALLFALHPINTEAVNWISGRTDILAAPFVLISLLLLLKALRSGSLISCFVAASAMFVGALAKETAIFFFPAAIVIILFYNKVELTRFSSIVEHIKARILFYSLFCISCGAYLFLRSIAYSRGDSGISHAVKGVMGGDSQIFNTIRIMLKASGFYVRKLFYPFPLNFGIVNISNYYVAVGIFLVLLICYLLWKRGLVAALFVSSFLVGSSAFLVAISRMAWTPLAERYMYIPGAILSVAIVFVLADFLGKYGMQKLLICLGTLFYAVSAYATVSRNIVWQDNVLLFEDTVRKSPEFQTAKNDLAAALLEKGRRQEAFAVISSMTLAPSAGNYNDLAILNKAMALQSNGDLLAARKYLKDNMKESSKLYDEFVKKLIAIDESCFKEKIGPALRQELKLEIVALTEKLQELSQDPFYFYRIGQLYLSMGKREKARTYFARAYRESPPGAYYKAAAHKLAEKLSPK